MPLVRISLVKGKSRDYIRSIADGVQQALHEAYNVPIDDRFQFVDEYEGEDLIYDANYLGIERSDDIVILHIVAGKWRDTRRRRLSTNAWSNCLRKSQDFALRMCRSFSRQTIAMTGLSATGWRHT